jgi:branched-subunit amino acid aminotransferase/4-amino-4-deoxychorismate lyase
MVNYLLKKSYQLKDLKEIDFKDLWGDHGVFTTMWIYDKPSKILFFKNHINNLIKSTKAYSIYKPSLKKNILELLKENLNSKTKYNHFVKNSS